MYQTLRKFNTLSQVRYYKKAISRERTSKLCCETMCTESSDRNEMLVIKIYCVFIFMAYTNHKSEIVMEMLIYGTTCVYVII